MGGCHLIPASDAGLVGQASTTTLARPSATTVPNTPIPVPTRPGRATRDRVKAHPAVAATSSTPALPETLTLPRLGISMPVVPTRLNGDGQMRMPDRPSTIGWYSYGPAPGSAAGSAGLAGHVDSREYGVGPLQWLSQARVGDRVVVDTTRGRQTFVVEQVELLAKQGLNHDALFERTGPARLRVVTCGGAYRPTRGGYQDNVVVSARRRRS